MRGLAVAVLVLLVLLLWWLMLRGWRRRAGAAADLPELPAAPADLVLEQPADPPGAGAGPLTEAAEGTYVSTTAAGDWLDRVTARGLGARSAAAMVVRGDGVGWARQGAPAVWAPAADLVAVRRASGMAGKYVERDGLVVVTWRLGGRALDTGFRPRYGEDAARLAAAVERLVGTRAEGAA